MKKEDIHITVSDGLLTIRGEKKHENEDKNENYHLVESHYGSFCRSMSLPVDADSDKVDATYLACRPLIRSALQDK